MSKKTQPRDVGYWTTRPDVDIQKLEELVRRAKSSLNYDGAACEIAANFMQEARYSLMELVRRAAEGANLLNSHIGDSSATLELAGLELLKQIRAWRRRKVPIKVGGKLHEAIKRYIYRERVCWRAGRPVLRSPRYMFDEKRPIFGQGPAYIVMIWGSRGTTVHGCKLAMRQADAAAVKLEDFLTERYVRASRRADEPTVVQVAPGRKKKKATPDKRKNGKPKAAQRKPAKRKRRRSSLAR